MSADEWSLRVTTDGALKALASLLSHKLRRNDYAALLREAEGKVPPAAERHPNE